MTPLCAPTEGSKHLSQIENYPDFDREERPVLMVAGHQDPYCHLPSLYQFAAQGRGNVQLAVLQGGHGFEAQDATVGVDDAKTTAAFQRNMHLLCCHLENFLFE